MQQSKKLSDSTFMVSEIVKLTGASNRWVQRWNDIGILRAQPETEGKGTGIHRRFSMAEVLIAAPLAQLGHFGMPIGEIKKVADEIRRQVIDSSEGGWRAESNALQTAWIKALGNEPAWLILAARHGGETGYHMVVELSDTLDFDTERKGIGPLSAYNRLVVVNLLQIWRKCIEEFRARGIG